MDTEIKRQLVRAAIAKQGRDMHRTASQIFWDVMDKRKWHQIRAALDKAGDKQSVGLWSEASLQLQKALTLKPDEERALNRMNNLRVGDPANMRNQVFKIANELGIKLPSGMFASDHSKEAKHRIGLPPYESWRKFVDFVQLRARQVNYGQTNDDIKHALKEIRNYAATSGEHARGLTAAHAALIDAQNILHEQDKLSGKFDKQMDAVRVALQKINQM